MYVANVMNNLLFLTDELQDPVLRQELKLPMIFIGYALTTGKMYKRRGSTFVISDSSVKNWGNSVVYGGIYLLEDFSHYIRVIDAYNSCSLSLLGTNHNYDLNHRVQKKVTTIDFQELKELHNLKYEEKTDVVTQMYLGNMAHNKIKHIVCNNMNSYRVQSGANHNIKKQIIGGN